ncbi:MAG TPA: hypothetical protein PKA53_01250 [Sphingobacterium sp.]|nr:hypothetical protein [Sphingobacterium sp.]
MKTIFTKSNTLSAGILLLCLSLTIACSKKKKDDPEPIKPTCRIITAGTGATAYNITYNDEGRISKVTAGSSIRTYEYTGNTVIVHTTNAGAFSKKNTYTLNSNGFVTNKRTENNEAGTDWDNAEFLYNGGTQLIKLTYTGSAGGPPTIATFSWANGNIQPDAGTFEYYTDKPKQSGDFIYYQELFEHDGMKVFNPKNAVKSLTVGSSTLLMTYTADQDEKITSMTIQRGTLADVVNYQYQCN